jgi:hypothetical protein
VSVTVTVCVCRTNAPTGFNGLAGARNRWAGGIGFIADYNVDGFGVGSPTAYSGDFFLPGDPMEGWSVEYKTSPTSTDTR